jgi:RND family efflux transporter MFP subunit
MTPPVHDLAKLRIDRDAPAPGVRRAFVRNVVLAGAAVVVIGGAIVFSRGAAAPVQVVVASASEAGGAAVAGVASVTANGYVVARTRASVSAKVAGRLAALHVSEGSFIRQGEVIARLDNADYRAQLTQAVAGLATARAESIEAVAERDQAERRRDAARHRAQSPQLVAVQDVEAADTRAATTAARAAAAAARVDAAEAGRRFAEATLDNTLIRAPFTGTVLRKEAEVGEVVAPSVGGGLTRGAVVTMADMTTLEVEVDVNEAYIGRVRSGQEARIILDAYPDTGFRGRVRQVVPTADRQRATVQVKVSITDRDPRILPEMGARVDFLAPEPAGGGAAAPTAAVMRVPAAAIREHEGQTVVWLVRDGRLEPRLVAAGPVSGGYREIRSGLAGGELLLVGGVDTPRPGLRVRTATP